MTGSFGAAADSAARRGLRGAACLTGLARGRVREVGIRAMAEAIRFDVDAQHHANASCATKRGGE